MSSAQSSEGPHTTILGIGKAWRSTSLRVRCCSVQWATWTTRWRYSLYSTGICPLPSENWWPQYSDKDSQRYFSDIGQPESLYAKAGSDHRYMLEEYQKLFSLQSSGFFHFGQRSPTPHQARRGNFLLIQTLVLIFGHRSGCIVIQIANNRGKRKMPFVKMSS